MRIKPLKKIRFSKILVKNFLVCWLPVTVLLISMSLWFYYYQTENVKKEFYTVNKSTTERISTMLDSLITDTEKLAANISFEQLIHQFLLMNDFDPSYDVEESNEDFVFGNPLVETDNSNITENEKWMKKLLSFFTGNYDYIDSIYIYSEKNNCIYADYKFHSLNKFKDNYWYETYKSQNPYDEAVVVRKKNDKYPIVMSIVKCAYVSDTKIGAVIININVEKLGNLLKNSEFEVDNLILINDENKIIYSDNYKYTGKMLSEVTGIDTDYFADVDESISVYENGDKIISVSSSRYDNFKYVLLVPRASYQNQLISILRTFIIIIFLGMTISFLLGIVMSIITFKPLGTIMEVFESEPIEDKPRDELHFILENIKKTIFDKEALENELEKQIVILNKYQAYALSVQINPHFLYNTLEVLKYMAIEKCGGITKLSDTIEDLGDLFRKNLDLESKTVDVSEEIENAKQYINILKLRYDNKFDVKWDISPDILDCKMLKLSLQPIVENAVCHGLCQKNYYGNIFIEASDNDGYIKFVVRDDGVGINEEILIKLRECLKEKYYLGKEFLGLCNINQRLKIIFGEESKFLIDSIPNEGTVVTMIFKALK